MTLIKILLLLPLNRTNTIIKTFHCTPLNLILMSLQIHISYILIHICTIIVQHVVLLKSTIQNNGCAFSIFLLPYFFCCFSPIIFFFNFFYSILIRTLCTWFQAVISNHQMCLVFAQYYITCTLQLLLLLQSHDGIRKCIHTYYMIFTRQNDSNK